ncbi:MAG: right-handed parallel beta-helix repeat-containing protein [Bacteroidota bacterium]
MKKFYLLLISLFFSSSSLIYAQLNGSYSVGSGGDYNTISDAIAAINSAGLTGDVTLNVLTGVYTERIDLSNLNNGDFMVTLEGEDLENTIISPPYEDVDFMAGINIQNTDHVTIRNLTINMPFESASASQTMYGVYSTDAQFISVQNNVIRSKEGIAIGGGINLQALNNIVVTEGVAFVAWDCNTLDVIHNTFHSERTGFRNFQASGNFFVLTEAVSVFNGTVRNVNVINNIFSGVVSEDPDGNAAISFGIDGSFVGNSTTFNLVSDFNLFDADLSMVVHGASGSATLDGEPISGDFSLGDWRDWDNRGYDLSSTSFSPDFSDDTDFRIGSTDFRFGTYLSAFSMDIDGETRVEGSVDVGADQFCISIAATESLAVCESYEFGGLTLTASGQYFGEFVATNGCDSLVTLNLTILEATSGSDDITAEGSYNWNGIIYSESGTYQQTLTNQVGCDSLATLNLTIEPYFLEGNFVIGSSAQADFSNFTEATADLQYATLTGNVEYFIEAGTYNDTLKISAINNGDFSITFNGEDESTTILHPLDSIDESGSGVLIDGTNHVTIQNLTLEMDDISDQRVSLNSNDTKGISIINASNITINNIDFKNDSEAIDFSSSTFFIASTLYLNNVDALTVSNCLFSGSGSHITIGDHNSVSISDNTFQTAKEVIRTTETGGDLLIERNDFFGPFNRAIEIVEIDDATIRSNDIDGIDGNESRFGILSSENVRLIIQDNRIKNVEFGIILDEDIEARVEQNRVTTTSSEAFFADRTNDLTVVNNFFGDVVFLSRSSDLDFIHNTVVAESPDERFEVFFFEVDDDATGDLAVRINNNIIVGGNQVADRLMGLVTVNENVDFSLALTLDHNLYYLADESGLIPLVTYEDNVDETSYGTLVEWQNAQPYDQNSERFEPEFVSQDDFHITNGSDYRFGTYIDMFASDIDGDPRTEGSVDVGADQFVCEASASTFEVIVFNGYEWEGVLYEESGMYSNDYISTLGCDSTATLNLTILTLGEEFTVEENTTDIIVDIGAIEGVVFSLGNDKDEALFMFNDNRLSFTNTPDFENPLDFDENNEYVVDVMATDEAGNISSTELTILILDVAETIVSVEEPVPSLKFYPNPVVDYLYFNNQREFNIRVMTLDGQILIDQRAKGSIDLSQLIKGTYLIEISQGDTSIIERIIKAN